MLSGAGPRDRIPAGPRQSPRLPAGFLTAFPVVVVLGFDRDLPDEVAPPPRPGPLPLREPPRGFLPLRAGGKSRAFFLLFSCRTSRRAAASLRFVICHQRLVLFRYRFPLPLMLSSSVSVAATAAVICSRQKILLVFRIFRERLVEVIFAVLGVQRRCGLLSRHLRLQYSGSTDPNSGYLNACLHVAGDTTRTLGVYLVHD